MLELSLSLTHGKARGNLLLARWFGSNQWCLCIGCHCHQPLLVPAGETSPHLVGSNKASLMIQPAHLLWASSVVSLVHCSCSLDAISLVWTRMIQSKLHQSVTQDYFTICDPKKHINLRIQSCFTFSQHCMAGLSSLQHHMVQIQKGKHN
jgi:hypothetical protein